MSLLASKQWHTGFSTGYEIIPVNRRVAMPEPIKILHVLTRMNRGGAEMRTLDVMRRADPTRFEFHICVLSGQAGTLDDEVRALGGRIHPVPLRRLGFGRDFRRLIRTHRFHVVHSHVHLSSGFMLRHAAAVGTPGRIAHFRNTHDGRSSGLLRRCQRALMRRWIRRYATDIVAVCRSAMGGAMGVGWRADPRCRVIYNGIEPPARNASAMPDRSVRLEFGLPPDAPLYLHVGRVAEQKNQPRLITVFACLTRRQPEARLLLVGRGGNALERDLRRRARAWGVSDRILFCGEREDVPRLLKAAEAMIFPSLWEGFPGAVLEACAAGVPVVASDLPGVREIAAQLPGVHCLSLSEPDEVWAETIDNLPRGAEAETARQAAQRRFAEGVFTIDRCVEQMSHLWEEAGSRQAV